MARRPQDKSVGGKRQLVPPAQRAGATPGRATGRPGAAGGKRPWSLPRIPLPHIPAIKLPAFAGRVAGIAAAVLVAVAVLGIVVANSPIFAITDVVVNGSEHVTQQTAEQLVNVPDGATLMNVDTGAIEEALSQNPWVSGATIERQFPHTLVITPTEHEVAAIAFIASSDVAWSISAEGAWIAPISLSVIMDAEGNVESTSSLAQADAGAQPDASAQGDALADGSGADADGAAGDGSADADTADADAADASADASASTAPAVPEGSQLLTGLDAAVALAQQDGAVLFTDVAADIEPSSGAEVTSEVLLAGLEYVNGFSAEFRSQVREMSLGSVEAISAILTSGIEVSLGEPTDISTKERIVTRLLEQEQGVVYINVSTPDQYTFRQA
ncbi:cell division protein FtsQ/DivIB [Enorma phocaeensis]|uniref:FtsQ-type POTRA domain-containing protein n=1 Tax=Enorma phocaeensis TaxID=1871019 RepID=A0A921LT11_9ACTN|nr:FtsQ-type POTRA domain-containing protein [Enorma phocaeensis]HJG37608.1 FtsQ-type POTRA domain-containing protein [Enorma phocaeensis]